MILVAIKSGFSIWLIICEAASMPSWQELMSMDVSGGEDSLANSEVLKEMMDKSSGMDLSLIHI